MLIRVYIGYGGKTPVLVETRRCAREEFMGELMYLFIEHDRIPFITAFRKGEQRSECIIVFRKSERRKDE